MKKIGKQNGLLIGLDLGTSAIKGVLMDPSGQIIAENEKKISFIHPKPGEVELDPAQHYLDICKVIQALAASASKNVAAIAMAAASGNSLLCNDTGNPMTNIISWLDTRKTDAPDNFDKKELRNIVGWPCNASFPLAHFSWWKQNCSELYRKAGHYCMNTDWLAFKLTGKWRMDHSTATTFHLQDQERFRYHRPYLKKLEITEDKLSQLVPSGKIIGKLITLAIHDTSLSEDTVLVSGCFDHPAAARAEGILEPGQLLLSCGTSWVGFFPELERKKIIDAELLCDPFLSEKEGPWGAIFSIPYIGRNIDWYIENVIASDEKDKYEIFNDLSAQAVPGANGLKIDLRDKPQFIKAEKKNICRAIMENAACLLNDKLLSLKKYGMEFNSATMVGGPSKSPIWPGIVAKTTGLKLTTGSLHSGAKGAAILAGIGIGIYENEHRAL